MGSHADKSIFSNCARHYSCISKSGNVEICTSKIVSMSFSIRTHF